MDMLKKIKHTILFTIFSKAGDKELITEIVDESRDITIKLELGEDFDRILSEINQLKDNKKELKRYLINVMFDYEEEK